MAFPEPILTKVTKLKCIMRKYITQIAEWIGKITVEINLRSYRRYVFRCAEFQETQVCPISLLKEILHKFYGNTTNTSVAVLDQRRKW